MSEPGQGPWISILLVCHNDGDWLPRCLESLRTQTVFARCELIIADNASDNGTFELAQKLTASWPNARCEATGGDLGFCAGTNRAASLARGQYLLVLNPDTWLEPDCLEQLGQELDRSGVGAVGPVVLNYEDNSLQGRGSEGFDFCGNDVGPPASRPPDPLFIISCFWCIRRELFLRLGMLDERGFMYGEEMDLCWRVWIAGERITSAPAARIHHRGAATVNPAGGTALIEHRTSSQKRFLANRNRLLFIAKNCQHMLLLMLGPSMVVVMVEGLATWVMTRSWSLANASCFRAITGLWQLRGHVRQQRRRVASFRRHGDLWMLRFFRLGFGRWGEVSKILKSGFPRFR